MGETQAETKAAAARKAPAKKAARPRRSPKVKAVYEAAETYFAAVSARDTEAMAASWHEDGIEDIVPLGVFRGPDGVRDLFTELFAAIPDFTFIVDRITADAEVATVQWRAHGNFTGEPFRGIEATGRRVDLRGCDCAEVVDGKLVRNTAYYDGAAFARSIGLLPPENSGADKAIIVGFNAVTKLRRAVGARTGGSK
jgi:steroid delta-isomerase-like uncharacterized protein